MTITSYFCLIAAAANMVPLALGFSFYSSIFWICVHVYSRIVVKYLFGQPCNCKFHKHECAFSKLKYVLLFTFISY